MVQRSRARSADPVRTTVVWSRRVVAIALVLGALGAGMSWWTQPVVLALAGIGFVAGMPHGAVDHVLLSRLVGRPLAVVTAGYAGCAVAVWALLRWAGPAPLVVVALLGVIHFGLGEVEAHRQVDGRTWGPVVTVMLAIAATGALLLPLARSGVAMQGVAAALSPGLGVLLSSAGVRAGIVVVWFVAACVSGVAALRRGRAAVLLDVVLVGALGAVLPPLVAFAFWFGGWHALRHTGRLLTVEPGCVALLRAGHARAAVGRLAGMATVPSLAAVATLAGLATVTATAADLPGAVAEALRVLLALTVPHMLVILWLDRRTQRVGTVNSPWGGGGRSASATEEPGPMRAARENTAARTVTTAPQSW